MGRRKIDIEKIADTNKRMVTFSKRRSGLMSKAEQLCKLCADIVACFIVFSPAGKPYTFSNSPVGVCDVVERFLEQQSNDEKQGNNNAHRNKRSMQCRNKAADGSDSCWWDNIDIDELDSLEKLKSARESLANLKQNLLARKEKLTAASSPLSSPSSTIDDSITEDRSAATRIEEEHEARETSWKDDPELDLNLYLGSQFCEKANTSLMLREANAGRD